MRRALTLAANNGVNEKDTITFSLSSNIIRGKNIILLSELPTISSNLMIDGTTQPGLGFGGVSAKIIIEPQNINSCKIGLKIWYADKVEVYGLLILNFMVTNPLQNPEFCDGISILASTNITIGALGKGNIISGNYYGIRCISNSKPFVTIGPIEYSYNIVIQSNILGDVPIGRSLQGNIYSIYLGAACNTTIGGDDLELGNNLLSIISSIFIADGNEDTKTNFTTIIKHNNLRVKFLAQLPPFISCTGIILQNDLQSKTNCIVANNTIDQGPGITVLGYKSKSHVFSNKINTILDSTSLTCIETILCDSLLIGGDGDSANIIRKAIVGVRVDSGKFVTIQQNNISCTSTGIAISRQRVPVPTIFLQDIQPNGIGTGTTVPFARLEIFNTRNCTNQIYNGEEFIDTVFADAQGEFKYKGDVNCNTSFTATTTQGTTSKFYVPYNFIIDTTQIIIQPSTCGKSNGKIFGLKIFEGVNWEWLDNAGNIVSTTDTSITVPAGTYFLRATLTSLGCVLTTSMYIIRDINPALNDANVNIKNSFDCKPNSGSITGIVLLH